MPQLPESKVVHNPKGGRPVGTVGERGMQRLALQDDRNQLFKGCTITDLTIIFRMDKRTVAAKITDVEPCGNRAGHPLWQIRDVAPYLVRPAGDIEEHIKKMRHNDLPPLLSKEFWNGQRSKLRYLEETGQLWRTDKVIGVLSEVFKTIKMNLLLVPDALERKTTLTEQQREEVRLAIDGTLEEVRDALVDQFEFDTEGPGAEDLEGPPANSTSPFDGEFEEDDEFTVPEPDYGDL